MTGLKNQLDELYSNCRRHAFLSIAEGTRAFCPLVLSQRIIVADFEDGLTIVGPSQVDEFDMQRHVEVVHGDRIRVIASGVERLAS